MDGGAKQTELKSLINASNLHLYTSFSVAFKAVFLTTHCVNSLFTPAFVSSMNNTARLHLISASKHYLGKNLFPLSDCHK